MNGFVITAEAVSAPSTTERYHATPPPPIRRVPTRLSHVQQVSVRTELTHPAGDPFRALRASGVKP